jgi:malate dehydrogenase
MGVPAVIGGNGIERIVEIELNEEERAMLAKSAKSVQVVVDLCKKA